MVSMELKTSYITVLQMRQLKSSKFIRAIHNLIDALQKLREGVIPQTQSIDKIEWRFEFLQKFIELAFQSSLNLTNENREIIDFFFSVSVRFPHVSVKFGSNEDTFYVVTVANIC